MVIRLEVFDTDEARPGSQTVVLESGALEEAKLASYDAGYAAGWEDATAAQSGDTTRIHADLARNLQALSFTYQEARSHVLRALEPLFEELMGVLLPAVARESLGGHVLDVLAPMAEALADAPIKITLNPAVRPAVEPLLAEATGLPIMVEEEPLMGEGQVYLRFGASETLVDLDRATAEITAALRGFFDLTRKES
jgi:hypothetical protein